jgi:hypothetical protein
LWHEQNSFVFVGSVYPIALSGAFKTSKDQCSTCASLIKSSYYFSVRLFSDFSLSFFSLSEKVPLCTIERPPRPAVPVCAFGQK